MLASILKAKGIPYQLEMSFDHIWVNYPGKIPNAMENSAVAIGRQEHGHFVLQWPKDFHPWAELQSAAGDLLDAHAASAEGPDPGRRSAPSLCGTR